MVLRVKDEQVAWVYALTDETWKMTSGFTVACMLHELLGLSQRVLFYLVVLTGFVMMHFFRTCSGCFWGILLMIYEPQNILAQEWTFLLAFNSSF